MKRLVFADRSIVSSKSGYLHRDRNFIATVSIALLALALRLHVRAPPPITAEIVETAVEETLAYYAFPEELRLASVPASILSVFT
jgi:hypothetical protein